VSNEGLGAEALLRIWEQGVGRGSQQRALSLLAAAAPERDPEALAGLPVGRRDAELLDLRERLLGPVLEAVAQCPRCGGTTGFSLTVDELRAAGGEVPQTPSRTLTTEGFEVRFRSPDGRDLFAASSAPDVPAARRLLLERCVEGARWKGEEIPASHLPERVVAMLGRRLEENDPLAVIPLALSCEACGARWLPLFDPADYLWQELTAEAERLLHEVHTLALAYHWSEATILAMSPARREFYLGLAPSAGPGEPEPRRPSLPHGVHRN